MRSMMSERQWDELKNNIEKAKKILGDRQALIIAKEKPLEEFSETGLKSLCPVHDDSAPSFMWYSKAHCFKCFGCGITYDIIAHYIDSGKTFLESCQELFRLANITYDFAKTPTSKEYRYPRIEDNTNRKKVEKYLLLRKISKPTLDYAGVKQDKKGNIVFEYYDVNKTLLTVKYRPSRKVNKGEDKSWCQKNSHTSPLLYGMHQIDTTKPLLITEGEIDRLAAIESGFKNAVSIPFGSQSTTWIEYNWEWLEQFSKIIIWSDNDEAGRKMNEKIIPRLGAWRCLECKGTEKDINLELFKHGKETVLKIIENAKDVPVKDIIDLSEIEDYDISQADGIYSNIKGLDKFVGKYFFGTVNLVFGINGSGKSTFINQVCIAEALEQGYQTFIFSGELTLPALKNWIEYPIAGKKHIETINLGKNQPRYYKVKPDVKEKIREWYKGKVHVYDKEFNIIASDLLKKMEELARKYGVKNFVLDNLMLINCSEYDKYNVFEAQATFVLKLCEFARNFNVLIHLLHHPHKVDCIRRLTKMDVAGMAKITNLVHYVTAIHRVTEKEKEGVRNIRGDLTTEPIKYDTLIDLLKNRPLGHQDKTVGCYFDVGSKRFYGDSDSVNRQYSWDTSEQVNTIDTEIEYSVEIEDTDQDLPY